MPLTRPDGTPVTAPADPSQSGATPQHEHERERAPAREAGQVVPLHAATSAAPTAVTHRDRQPSGSVATRSREAVTVWLTEARDTGRATVDGRVWRARPASLRDREARIRRAEWSGGLPALAIPGKAFGYLVALPVTVLARALEETTSRPLRLLTLALAVLIPLLLA